MRIRKRMLKMAEEKGPIWEGIEQQGYYDAKYENSAKVFCKQFPEYSYKQYNSKSKGIIFRIAPPEYFTQFEQELQQNQITEQYKEAINIINKNGFVDLKEENQASYFIQYFPEYEYRQYNSQSKGIIFRVSTPEYFAQFEENLIKQQQEQSEQNKSNKEQEVIQELEQGKSVTFTSNEIDGSDFLKRYPEYNLDMMTSSGGNTTWTISPKEASTSKRLMKRMASNNIMTSEEIAQSVINNVINNEGVNIHGLLIDPYFEMTEDNGKISFSGKFEHLEIDEDVVDSIGEWQRNRIESTANGNKDFEEKVKEAIKNTISKPNHLYNDFLNRVDELTITGIDVYVIEKRYLQQYTDSAMVVFYVDMETM